MIGINYLKGTLWIQHYGSDNVLASGCPELMEAMWLQDRDKGSVAQGLLEREGQGRLTLRAWPLLSLAHGDVSGQPWSACLLQALVPSLRLSLMTDDWCRVCYKPRMCPLISRWAWEGLFSALLRLRSNYEGQGGRWMVWPRCGKRRRLTMAMIRANSYRVLTVCQAQF